MTDSDLNDIKNTLNQIKKLLITLVDEKKEDLTLSRNRRMAAIEKLMFPLLQEMKVENEPEKDDNKD